MQAHEVDLSKPRIDLYNLQQASLIILCQSGVIYRNQTCGYYCHQRFAEGVLVPLLARTKITEHDRLYIDYRFDYWESIGETIQIPSNKLDRLFSLLEAALEIQCPLYKRLSELHWEREMVAGITENGADELDKFLSQWPETRGIHVDRAHLEDSEEAWIYVNISSYEEAEYHKFGVCKGILTWPNSD